jgi:ATP-dependent Clp protease adaptor protein ClpS
MLEVHHKGAGKAGRYTRDIAESKVETVMTEARESGMPLKLTAEPE